ncbi:hypothetical protein GJ496_009244 [Pomphorhynchus laevis]|nr:hypothetical protein GJ496_009244 [Pomphorhynchus laevis]
MNGRKVTFDEALSATGTAVSVPEYLSDIIGSDRLFDKEVADMIFLADMDIVDATIEHDGLIETGDDSAYITGPELRNFDNIWCAENACNLYDVMKQFRRLWTHHEGRLLKFEINRDERLPENGYQVILLYHVNDKVAGIALWGVVGKIRMARQIISEQRHLSEIQDLARRIMSFDEDCGTKETVEGDEESSEDMDAIFT